MKGIVPIASMRTLLPKGTQTSEAGVVLFLIEHQPFQRLRLIVSSNLILLNQLECPTIPLSYEKSS